MMTKLFDRLPNRYVGTHLLDFDKDNQRFTSWRSERTTEPFDPFTVLCEMHGIRSLIAAIVSGAYFEAEPLLVVPTGSRYTVLDGNRRLAAVRAILDHERYAHYYPDWLHKPTSELLESLTQIPVIIVADRQLVWPLLAQRHGMGTENWDSYTRASFFHRVTDSYLVSDYQVANYLGIGRWEFNRFMTPYRLIAAAEKAGIWNRRQMERKTIYYSLLAKTLQDERIQRFVGMESLDGFAAAALNLANVGRLLNWLHGNKEKGLRPALSYVDSDIRKLGRVVESDEAMRYLDEHGWLERAYQMAVQQKFPINSDLHKVHNKLGDMLATVPDYEVPYEGEGLAKQVKRAADDLYERVLKKRIKNGG
ncbi:hypothetical protein [Parapedobacter koreensis]|uniref:hypothetical protein n=1 Tax=Parapedobacter koreensis TaxID=332977 RepID=UPI0015A613EE|nr:hypothetical protein [Parapedobacter koreensis]